MMQIQHTAGVSTADVHHEHSAECGLLHMLPPPMQEACQKNVHLLEYLHSLPIEQLGVPQYHPKLSKKLADLKQRNLIYPVSPEILIHILSSPGEERDYYIPLEPSFSVTLDAKMAQVEERLLELAPNFAMVNTPQEREQALLACLESICQVTEAPVQAKTRGGWLSKRAGSAKVQVTPREFLAIRYLVLRDKVGLGVLEPMVRDSHIEDISCSGLGSVFLEHKIFRSVKSTVNFDTHEVLDQFVLRLSENIKRPVTMRNPIVDAVLPDGSRINIVYGREVSARGSNFSIRKFSETPLSILELIEFGSLDYRMAAYLSIMLEEGMNVFVAGETASGKTTLLNAITTFIPPAAKVVSIEDTPELQVPHSNWIREVAKPLRKGEQGAEVTMFDLLKAALRQRPNIIIIGEIRGEEGAIAFQAMQTGHAVMATFHASSVEKLIQRLTGAPINIPKTYIDNLNVVVIQSAVKLPNGKPVRRTMSINEIVGYDPPTNTFSFVEAFRWDPARDTFEFVGDKNSYILEQKIAPRRGIAPNKKWEIYNLIDKRAKVLRRLHQEMGVTGFYDLLKVLARAHQEGIF